MVGMSPVRRTLAVAVAALLPTFALVAAGQQAPERARATYARALELESKGEQGAALALLWEAAALAPRDADIQNRLGKALERIGALDAAIAAYRSAISERADFREASNNLILALAKAGQGAEAVERARALVRVAPDDPERLFTLGLALSEVDVEDAIVTFRRVLSLAPKHVLARYNLALVLKRTDRLGDALNELERILAIEPRPEAYYTRGMIYSHQGDLDRAAMALGDAVAASPNFAEAHAALGSVLKARRDWPGAAAALRRAIGLTPDDPAPHFTLAQVQRSAGDERGAAAELARANLLRQRQQSDQEATMWTAAGTQKLDRGDLAGALDLFRRASAVNGGYAPAHYQMGRTLQALGRAEEAQQAFARAAALNPSLATPRAPESPQR
jgi:tetratricopeptide (TPR) repeat protein